MSTPSTPIKASDVNDLRRWFNHYESWGDLRGVHWFESALTDLPRVGWNVETVIGVSKADESYNASEVNRVLGEATSAWNYGLVNIIRIDYKHKDDSKDCEPGHRSPEAVPIDSTKYEQWKNNFNQAVNALAGVCKIFLVGNEPIVEGRNWDGDHCGMTSQQYADAFDYLYTRKVAGMLYLAAGPAAWSFFGAPPNREYDRDWLRSMANALSNVDGFALHTYGSPDLNWADDPQSNQCVASCADPRRVCRLSCDPTTPLTRDASFRRFRDYIEEVRSRWAGKPVYLTEFNTHGYGAASPDDKVPQDNYPTGLMQQAYEEVRNYNTETNPNRPSYPRVLSLCWFVDDSRGNSTWAKYALSNSSRPRLVQARTDFKTSDTSTGITA
jgi:hypothetical protein